MIHFPFICPKYKRKKEYLLKKVELLAPVGKLENAYAAIENGADALFVGGKLFNARHSADNFDKNELQEIVHYAKLRGVKIYVTVNTLVKEKELASLFDYLKELSSLCVDAIIVQDLGVATIAKNYFPHLALHASTQMTAHSLEDVLFLKQFGFKRVVLAREMQLTDIAYITKHVDIEIETFVHGALCYSYSGQCLMSSLIGGRSGNRGCCAQSCRMQYSLVADDPIVVDTVHMLSPKDICTLPLLEEFINSGITSFKIEGRMKSPEYVATVIKNYRKYIDLALTADNNYTIDAADIEEMQSIFNRGGFSTGYYHQKAGLSMITEKTPKNIGLPIGKVLSYNPKTKKALLTTNKELHPGDGLEIWNKKEHIGTGIAKVYPANSTFEVLLKDRADPNAAVYLSKNHLLLKSLRATYIKSLRKLPISLYVQATIGQPIELTLTYNNLSVTAQGDIITTAENMPITKEAVQKQVSKLGSTSFEATQIEVTWPSNAFIAVSKLNELRRQAVTALEEAILSPKAYLTETTYEPIKLTVPTSPTSYSAKVTTLEQLQMCLEAPFVTHIYWEWNYDSITSKKALLATQAKGKSFFLALPPIMKDTIWQQYQEDILSWEHEAIQGYLLRTYGQAHFLQRSTKEKIIDYTLNVFNNAAIATWHQQHITRITPSLELSKKELLTLNGTLEKVIYGHYPVMVTEQCLLGNYKKCHKQDKIPTAYKIKDRKEVYWPQIGRAHV